MKTKTLLVLAFCAILFTNFNLQASTLIEGGPDITGKYKFKDGQKVIAIFKITKSAKGIFVEEGSADDIEIQESTVVKDPVSLFSGEYTWDDKEGSYRKFQRINGVGHYLRIFPTSGNFLGIRKMRADGIGDTSYGAMYKIEGSLEDILARTKADVSSLLGTWNIEGRSAKVVLTSGVDNDLLVRFGTSVYELNKVEGNFIDTYDGSSKSGTPFTLKVLNANKIKIDVNGSEATATRKGGSFPAKMVSTSNSLSVNKSSVSQPQAASTNPLDTKLHTAIKQVDSYQVEELLDAGASANALNAQGRTALHEAVMKQDTGIIESLINNNANINTTNSKGRTPLDIAIQKSTADDASTAMMLLDNEATVTNYGIDQAILKGNEDLIKRLADSGANKNYITTKAIEKGKTSIFQMMVNDHGVVITNQMFDKALSARKYPIADMMIAQGFNANYAMDASIKKDVPDLVYSALAEGGNANNALKYAVKKSDTELATLAINEHSADANVGLKDAVAKKSIKMVTLLLDNGADANAEIAAVSTTGNDALLLLMLERNGDPNLGILQAANAAKMSTIKLLLDAGADGDKVMPIAIEKNSTEMVNLAIEGGADGTSSNFINTASVKGNLEIVNILLEAGADANDGILGAVISNKVNVVKILLGAGADGTSAELLTQSTKHNNTQLTGMLLEAGAEPQDGIVASVNNKAPAVLQQLIDAGGDANDQALLTTAIGNNDTGCSTILLNLGLNANDQLGNGYYYLHQAAEKNNSTLTSLLLKKGAEVDAIAQGSTPLHFAVRDRKALATVGLLIEAGADVNAVNGKGKKVLRIAKGNKIKKLLKQNGAVKK